MKDRLFFELIKTNKSQLFKCLSFELVKLQRVSNNLAKARLSIAKLFSLSDPLSKHFSIRILVDLEPLVRLKFFVSDDVEYDKSKTKDIRLKGFVSNDFGSLYPD